MGLVWHPRPTPAQLLPARADPSCSGLLAFTSERWVGALHGAGNQIVRVLSRVVPNGFYWYVKHLHVSQNDVNAHPIKAFLIPPEIVVVGAFIGDGERIPLVANTNIAGFVGPTQGVQIPPSDPSSVLSQGGTRIGEMNPNAFVVPARWALFGLGVDSGSALNHRMEMSAVFLELPDGTPVPSF